MSSSNGWPLIPLKAIATPVTRSVSVVPGNSYRTLGVRWWGGGAYERQTIDGSETAVSTLNEVRENDLIINKIWVRHGSVAVVSAEVAGCVGSNEFPTFEVHSNRVIPRWLHWYSKTQQLWTKCDALSQGSSGKNRIRPEKFLSIEIPVPPIEEQQRIVARIDDIASRIEEAKQLRQRAEEEHRAFQSSAVSHLFQQISAPVIPLGSLLREKSRNGLSTPPRSNPPGHRILRISAGTSRNDGLVDESDFKFVEANEKEIAAYRLEQGDLLACRFNGNLHYVGRFSLFSGESNQVLLHPDKLIRFRIDSQRALPEYVRDVMNSPIGRRAIEAFCQTTAGNIGISASNLNTVAVPIPSLDQQHNIIETMSVLRTKSTTIMTDQKAGSTELNALLPSILDRAFRGEF